MGTAEKIERPFYDPGWYCDLSNEEYHGSFGTSSSQLKTLVSRPPAAFAHSLTTESAQTENMKLGTLVHTLILEPEKFEDEYFVDDGTAPRAPTGMAADIVMAVAAEGAAAWQRFVTEPAMNKRTKAGKEEFAAFQAKCEREGLTVVKQEHIDTAAIYLDYTNMVTNKTVVTREMFDKGRAMADSVLSDPIASTLLQDKVAESSIYWWHQQPDGEGPDEMLKIRPDALCPAHGVVADIKTTGDASYSEFVRAVQRFNYHLSGAMYMEGVNQCEALLKALGLPAFTNFVFICVESREPYLTTIYDLGQEYLQLGKTLYHGALRSLHYGRENNWPGYASEVRVLEPPAWAFRRHVI